MPLWSHGRDRSSRCTVGGMCQSKELMWFICFDSGESTCVILFNGSTAFAGQKNSEFTLARQQYFMSLHFNISGSENRSTTVCTVVDHLSTKIHLQQNKIKMRWLSYFLSATVKVMYKWGLKKNPISNKRVAAFMWLWNQRTLNLNSTHWINSVWQGFAWTS